MIRHVTQWFHPRRLPLMTRQSYRHELVASASFPWAMAMVEPGVIGVLADKVFDASDMLLAVFVAAPMFANLTSLLWARLSRGRAKVRFITFLQITVLALVLGVALLPTGPAAGAWGLAAIMVVARCTLSGIVTVRSNLWRLNYPRHYRGRITGRLSIVLTATLATAALGAAVLLDVDARSFRWFYPLTVLIASVGVVAFGRIRMRGERGLLRDETASLMAPTPGAVGDPPIAPAEKRSGVLSVLRHDRSFRTYLTCQFALGMSNMMTEAPVLKLASEASDRLGPLSIFGTPLRVNFLAAIALTQIIPVGLSMLTLPLWARALDRMHIARFRVRQSWFFVVAELLVAAGALAFVRGSVLGTLALLMAARLIVGVARGGGMIAWNLGHNDFASRRLVSTYMALHVTLTGIRGAFAPFLGMALYTGWNELRLPWATIPGWQGIGPAAFLVAATVGLAGTLGFHHLARALRATGRTAAVDPD